ncbi:hypothetical protein [Azohydromonas sediminis]|uniref:hypothetical protein n=1 Tax=Azohydromonas sediminis TaxID=2259674 RepID=UPI0013C32E22|nr:hypothetical protein [Azohydromonas sediminis]
MPRRRHLIRAAGAAVAAALCGLASAQATAPDAAASAPPAPAEHDAGLLYLFNDSGPTLIPSPQVVTDNGAKLASLPRGTYAVLRLAPGPHLLKPDPPLWKQQVQLDVVAGRRYYVVVAYRPERSWATPLGGPPLVLREITAEQAAPLIAQMTRQ